MTTTARPAPSHTVTVPLDSLEPNPFNVRTALAPRDLAGLSKSIADRGLIHPILVRPHPDPERFGSYQIVCGERRFSAIKLLSKQDPERWRHIPVRVESLDDTAALAAIMQENELRQDWTAYERAAFFRAIYDDKHFLSIRKMAKALDISLTTLHRYLRVFDLPEGIVKRFRDGQLSIAMVEVILDAPKDVRQALADHLVQHPLSKEMARRVAEHLAGRGKGDWIERAGVLANAATKLSPLPGARLKIELTGAAPAAIAAELRRLADAFDGYSTSDSDSN